MQGTNRRWSSIQAQEFTHLYSVLTTLVCSCDVATQLTVGKKEHIARTKNNTKEWSYVAELRLTSSELTAYLSCKIGYLNVETLVT